jgi:hypothetical protein
MVKSTKQKLALKLWTNTFYVNCKILRFAGILLQVIRCPDWPRPNPWSRTTYGRQPALYTPLCRKEIRYAARQKANGISIGKPIGSFSKKQERIFCIAEKNPFKIAPPSRCER